jgi:hypothetical protein
MTRYTVVWHDTAQGQLAAIWLGAANKTSITNAARRIDVALSIDAASKGKALRRHRELRVAPLRVLFAVSETDRLVSVIYVVVKKRR